MPPRPLAPRVSLKAVVFDVDGVLVQSMERHYEAYRKAFSTIDVEIRKEEVFENEGRRSREVIESLAKARDLGLPMEKLESLNRLKQATFASFGPLPLYPGARELVEKLKDRGLLVAAVTGTARANVDNHFQGGFADRFDVIVTADDVTRTKPDPEPYLSALSKLGLRPEEALVVENATLGVRAAKAAGIRVVAVTSTLPREKLHEADEVVAQLPDVWGVVEEALA